MENPAKDFDTRLETESVREIIENISRDLFNIPLSLTEPLLRQLPPEDIRTLVDKTLETYHVTHGTPHDIETAEELAEYVCEHGKTDEQIGADLNKEAEEIYRDVCED